MSHHINRNRTHWQQKSDWYRNIDRECWQTDHPHWGIWRISEQELNLLGGLEQYRDKDIIELGAGTAYWAAWFKKLGARPVAVDLSSAQLELSPKTPFCQFD